MTIAEARTSCKAALRRTKAYILGLPRDVLLVTALLLACSASFGLGVQVGHSSAGSESGEGATATAVTSLAPTTPSSGEVVASKNGTRYYPAGCSGASRISSANKVTFASAGAAIAAGYTLAVGCKSN